VVNGKEPRSANEDLGDSAGTRCGGLAGLLALFHPGAFTRAGDPEDGSVGGTASLWDPPADRARVVSPAAPTRCTSPAASNGTPRPDGWEGLRVRRGSRPPPAPPCAVFVWGGLAANPTLPRSFRVSEGALCHIRPRPKSRTHTTVARRARRVSPASPRSGASSLGTTAAGGRTVWRALCEPAVRSATCRRRSRTASFPTQT
jgi:hypothetical protein